MGSQGMRFRKFEFKYFSMIFFFIIGIMLILYLENMMLVLRRFGLICYRLNNILASYYFDTIVEISYLLI